MTSLPSLSHRLYGRSKLDKGGQQLPIYMGIKPLPPANVVFNDIMFLVLRPHDVYRTLDGGFKANELLVSALSYKFQRTYRNIVCAANKYDERTSNEPLPLRVPDGHCEFLGLPRPQVESTYGRGLVLTCSRVFATFEDLARAWDYDCQQLLLFIAYQLKLFHLSNKLDPARRVWNWGEQLRLLEFARLGDVPGEIVVQQSRYDDSGRMSTKVQNIGILSPEADRRRDQFAMIENPLPEIGFAISKSNPNQYVLHLDLQTQTVKTLPIVGRPFPLPIRTALFASKPVHREHSLLILVVDPLLPISPLPFPLIHLTPSLRQ